MTLKIAIIGSRGIPAKYGGFETFVDEISKRLVAKGYNIYVSCEGGITPKIPKYNGVNLFYFPLNPFFRVIYEPIYDIYSLVKSSIMCDCIYMLGYSAGFFFFIPKIFAKELFVNVDGIEWRRDKYNKIEKSILYLNEIFAVLFSDVIIADSIEIKKYIESKHGKNTVYIPYGVEQLSIELWNSSKLKEISNSSIFTSLERNNYYLVVARLEPENNIHVIVEGFLLSNTTKKLIIVGNFLSEKYKLSIDRIITQLGGNDRIVFTKGIYKKDLLNMLRQNCFVYLHGHSAGGTNPSLLEAMVMKNIIIAHDNKFNREVGSNTIITFTDSLDLKTCIENIEDNYSTYLKLKHDAYERVLSYYSWKKVAREYNRLFNNVSLRLPTKNTRRINYTQTIKKLLNPSFFSMMVNNLNLIYKNKRKGI